MSALHPADRRAIPAARAAQRARVSRSLWRVALYVLAIAGAGAFLIPFFWMLSTSLKPFSELYIFPPNFLPLAPRPRNYADAWSSADFTRYTLNTLFITAATLVGVLASSAVCAFGFARLRFVGRDALFICVLASVMLPQQVTLIPLYIIFKQLHWLNSFKPLIIPAWFGGGALNIFLLRQYFLTIPRELDEAARIDGCSTFGIFWRIMLPLAKPVLAVVTIFHVQNTWTDFLGPVLYLNTPDKFTLALGVYSFQSQLLQGGLSHQEQMMAVAAVMVLPIVLIFIFAQRYMVRGVVLSGIKG